MHSWIGRYFLAGLLLVVASCSFLSPGVILTARTDNHFWEFTVMPQSELDEGFVWVKLQPLERVKERKIVERLTRLGGAVLVTQENGNFVPVRDRSLYKGRTRIYGRLDYGDIEGDDIGSRQVFVETSE